MISQECEEAAKELLSQGQQFELEQLLNGKYDSKSARMTITAGAGGTEACDWVDMLLRMYTRHAEKMKYTISMEDKTVCRNCESTQMCNYEPSATIFLISF